MLEKPFILDTDPVSAETQKIAEVELNETPERVQESVAELRRLLHESEDLHFDDDEKTLKIFLRPAHFYPESALKLVSIYFVITKKGTFSERIRERFFLFVQFTGKVLDCKRREK